MSLKPYRPPFFLFNGHLQTIYPTLFRKIPRLAFAHEEIATPDDDFLDLFWSTQQSNKLVIISHALEGNAHRHYMVGMATACFHAGFDVVRWNFRGCGDQLNRQRRFYHSGATEDLNAVVDHCRKKGYHNISLVGFSLGGNLTLKYIGELKSQADKITKAVALSVPLDLLSSCHQISQPSNRVYANRFLKSLKKKVVEKAKVRADINIDGIDSIRTLTDFDDRYTAPLHGFGTAVNYYKQCSAVRFLDAIEKPVLIINAINDPFLTPACYPKQLNPNIQFESPAHGGHVGFTQFTKNGLYWSEERAVAFLSANASANHD